MRCVKVPSGLVEGGGVKRAGANLFARLGEAETTIEVVFGIISSSIISSDLLLVMYFLESSIDRRWRYPALMGFR